MSARRRQGRVRVGVLALAGGLLVISGGVRLGLSGLAFASAGPPPAAPQPRSAQCLAGPDIDAMLAAIHQREVSLGAREVAVLQREQNVALATREVKRKMAALGAVEKRLTAKLALASTAASNDITQLASIYENMKPKTASMLFATMEPDFAAGFLARMRPASAAAILSGMKPETAYAISVVLAGRNANVPRK